MQQDNCNWCGASFIKKNSVHKFCSPSCKKKSWRKENKKPEFPSFITTSIPPKREAIINHVNPVYYEPTPSPDVNQIINELETPKRDIKRARKLAPTQEKKELTTSKNPLRDEREKKVMDALMNEFDRMLSAAKNELEKSELYSTKKIEIKIRKLESKRAKVIKQGNKLNKAIRRYVKKVSKDVESNRISNHFGQKKIDIVRKKEVDILVDIIKRREWIFLFQKEYYFL